MKKRFLIDIGKFHVIIKSIMIAEDRINAYFFDQTRRIHRQRWTEL